MKKKKVRIGIVKRVSNRISIHTIHHLTNHSILFPRWKRVNRPCLSLSSSPPVSTHRSFPFLCF